MSQQATDYLKSVFSSVDESQCLGDVVANGILLAKFAGLLQQQKTIKVDERDELFMKAANVQKFTDYCKTVGIPGQFIPTPTDVVNKDDKAIRDIELCLWIIAKLSKVGVWKGAEKNVKLEGIRIAEIDLQSLEQDEQNSEIKEDKTASHEPEGLEATPTEDVVKEKKPKKDKSVKEKDSKKDKDKREKKDKGEKKDKSSKNEESKDANEEKKAKKAKSIDKSKEEEQVEKPAAASLPATKDAISAEELERIEERACYEKQDMTVLHFPEPKSMIPTYRSEIVVAGEPQVGKTTFCMRLHTGRVEFKASDVPTVFERKYLHQVDRNPANLHLILRMSNAIEDIGKCNFLFLCFSFASRKSFDAIPKYLKIAKKTRVDVILLGLQADNKTAGITFDMVYHMLGEHKEQLNSFAYHSMSALKGYGIGALLDGLEFYTEWKGGA